MPNKVDDREGRTTQPIRLSEEQRTFVKQAKSGHNILVDACIGSGKTTAIQYLCNELSTQLRILYLTYNKLLKLDAKAKIHNKNVTVTNYHGFASLVLMRHGIRAGVSDLIQTFNHAQPPMETYDVLIIDEYQDIEQELAEMLEVIKASNPNMQIIAVGDMKQKIYDKTTLQVPPFIDQFLGEHITLEFTQCFRLSKELAGMLGRVWQKQIVGVNQACQVETMNERSVVRYLSAQKPQDILCLGARTGSMARTLNMLEERFPYTFNKHTVYASISDTRATGATEPKATSAIFTTFDSSKGMERNICVVFDFNSDYWQTRLDKPQQSYEILRNIFCVAASRGKKKIIFVTNDAPMLTEQMLSTPVKEKQNFAGMDISSMFDFKYKEDIEDCFSKLSIATISEKAGKEIEICDHDGLIDLSPCLGVYQKAVYFNGYDIEREIETYLAINQDKAFLYSAAVKEQNLDKKILFLTAIRTNQNRYFRQVQTPYVEDATRKSIVERLQTRFSRDERVQVGCNLAFRDRDKSILFTAIGLADVVKDGTVYQTSFKSELAHEDYLQCAMYMIALNIEKGFLWNVRDDSLYEVKIPDTKAFLNAVARTVTKGYLKEYYGKVGKKPVKTMNSELSVPKVPTSSECAVSGEEQNQKNVSDQQTAPISAKIVRIAKAFAAPCGWDQKFFAVIDTETNWNQEIMSIGIAIINARNFYQIDEQYFVLEQESKVGGMFSDALLECEAYITSRSEAIRQINQMFAYYGISSIFVYNTSSVKESLEELSWCTWYDIVKVAAYKQHNPLIPQSTPTFKTGRMKKGYGLADMMRLLTGNETYHDTHNAIMEARDAANIMQMLHHEIAYYQCAKLTEKGEAPCEKTG